MHSVLSVGVDDKCLIHPELEHVAKYCFLNTIVGIKGGSQEQQEQKCYTLLLGKKL